VQCVQRSVWASAAIQNGGSWLPSTAAMRTARAEHVLDANEFDAHGQSVHDYDLYALHLVVHPKLFLELTPTLSSQMSM
jgi:hypothetical protein